MGGGGAVIEVHKYDNWRMLSSATPKYFQSGISFLRTKVRGDFNIHGTKYFQDAVFHQKSKNDVVSLLYLWLAKKLVLYMKY